ncbi:MAG: hypothetical protein ABFS05_08045 [Bacteroidota bacterium]
MNATYSFVFDRRKEIEKKGAEKGKVELLVKFSDGTNVYKTTKVSITPQYRSTLINTQNAKMSHFFNNFF